jgi:hypothetical protein
VVYYNSKRAYGEGEVLAIIYDPVALLSAPRMARMSAVSTIVYEPVATERLSSLLRDWPMAKRVIDLKIEKNKELTTNIKGTVERRYKKSA